MDDDIKRPVDQRIAQDPVFCDILVIRDVGQILVTDDDELIIAGLIAFTRLIDPIVARIAAEQDDFRILPSAKEQDNLRIG